MSLLLSFGTVLSRFSASVFCVFFFSLLCERALFLAEAPDSFGSQVSLSDVVAFWDESEFSLRPLSRSVLTITLAAWSPFGTSLGLTWLSDLFGSKVCSDKPKVCSDKPKVCSDRSRRDRSRSSDRYRSRRVRSHSWGDQSRSSDRYRSRRDRSRRDRSRSSDRFRSHRQHTCSPARQGGRGHATDNLPPLTARGLGRKDG